jgi:F0F1-type ATP synthase membrane subunit b/b'
MDGSKVFWLIVALVVLVVLAYRFWPKGRTKIDEFGSKIDKHTDNDGYGPFW